MVLTAVRYCLQRVSYAYQLGRKRGLEEHSGVSWETLVAASGHDAITEVLDLTGSAMSPTLNPRALKDRDAVDHLLLRRLPLPSPHNCHVGDVVAFDSPYRFGDQQSVLIRRVAAMPGDQMLSDSLSFEPFFIPDGFCWVLADNEKSDPAHVVDSRFFGPLPLDSIRGRVIYSAYDAQDHGAVKNSSEATRLDEVVLTYELSLDRLYKSRSL